VARWPKPREMHPPVEAEFDLTETCRKYPGAPGVGFVDSYTFWPPTSHWPARVPRLGGHHTWYVGGEEPETLAPERPEPEPPED
jgi:hypothetical protein